ncbi:MAG: YhbY family RNA-binding protein [Candidatus Helarchaeota archaeon]
MKKSEKMKKQINELWSSPPILILGKNGVNEQFLNEFKKQIKRNKIIKLKILKSAFEFDSKENIVSNLESLGDAKCVEIRGNHAIFLKSKKKVIE